MDTPSREARFEYQTETSNKFWEPRCEGNRLTVRFGKIGTDGQAHTKVFPSPARAEIELRKLVCDKLAKGYKPTATTVSVLLDGASPIQDPRAAASLNIGEHVPDEVVADVCGWLTACIQHGLMPRQFASTWSRFADEEDEQLAEALGRSGEEFWLDVMEYDEGGLDGLYAEAVENGADRFIWFNNNAYIDIVALRGDPGTRAIEVCVLTEENCQDKKGRRLNHWPEQLDPGAPIAWMSCDSATLRNGQGYVAIQ